MSFVVCVDVLEWDWTTFEMLLLKFICSTITLIIVLLIFLITSQRFKSRVLSVRHKFKNNKII